VLKPLGAVDGPNNSLRRSIFLPSGNKTTRQTVWTAKSNELKRTITPIQKIYEKDTKQNHGNSPFIRGS
jgi:hypothetical protein